MASERGEDSLSKKWRQLPLPPPSVPWGTTTGVRTYEYLGYQFNTPKDSRYPWVLHSRQDNLQKCVRLLRTLSLRVSVTSTDGNSPVIKVPLISEALCRFSQRTSNGNKQTQRHPLHPNRSRGSEKHPVLGSDRTTSGVGRLE